MERIQVYCGHCFSQHLYTVHFSVMSDPTVQFSMTLEQAHSLLSSFDCANPRKTSEISVETLKDALLILNSHADYHIFGICADDMRQGYGTLEQYADALGDDLDVECPEWDGPVYVKYNTKTGLFHVDTYVGDHRGVLVSFQSAYEQGVNDLYGHFPLGLFAA